MLETINGFLEKPFDSLDNLLEYYRERLPRRVGNYRLEEVGPIMSSGSPEEIRGYLQNVFSFNGISVDMGEKIDWYAAPDGDLEWNGGLVRQGHLVYLADAYERTGEEKYVKVILAHMLDYIRRVPPFDPAGKPYLEYKKSTWRPFEAAGRAAENWPVALAKIIGSPSVTPEAFGEIFRSIHEHAAFLSKHHWKTGNHACLEVAGLGVISVFFPEFARSGEWISYAVHFLTDMIDRQFYPDGYTREMSGAYHWVAMRNYFAFYEAACRNGFASCFPEAYIRNLHCGALAEMYQQKPDFSLPVTNDSNATTRHREQLTKLREILGEETVEYRISGGLKGRRPADTSHYFPSARVGIMRSDWTPQAVYLDFDMGDWGTNHMNGDQLSVELSAYGRNLLVNCGRWRYTTSPGVSWLDTARYFKTTAAYNSVLVDGLCQMPGDARGWMHVADRCDYAKGVFSAGYGKPVPNADEAALMSAGVTHGMRRVIGDAGHTREVFFCKPSFFIIRDTIRSDRYHRAQQLWHMTPGDVEVSDDGSIACSVYGDANMMIRQLGSVRFHLYKGSREPLRGYYCPRYGCLEPAPELEYEKEGSGLIRFETLLFPVRGYADLTRPPRFTKEEAADGIVYCVGYAGNEFRVMAPDNGEWYPV